MKHIWIIILLIAAIGCASTEEETMTPAEKKIDIEIEGMEITEEEAAPDFEYYPDDDYGNTDGEVSGDGEDVDFADFPDTEETLDQGGGVIALPEKEEVEEPLFEEPEAPVVDTPKVKTAGGFYRTTRDCNVREGTNTESGVLNKVKKGTRLWVEPATQSWRTVYTRKGEAYMHRFCFGGK